MARRWGRGRTDDTELAIMNFAFTFGKVMLGLMVALFFLINPANDVAGIRPNVEIVISITWSKDAKVDVDTWMLNSFREVINFTGREAGVVFLDRDDLGDKCLSVCEENVSIRGMVPGEYVLNLNVYSASNTYIKDSGTPMDKPLPVHIRITRMNPVIRVVWETDVVLTKIKEEKHIVRFYISNNEIGEFDTKRPISIMRH